MFQTALIESNHAIRTTSRWPAVISIALQTACAAALLSIPLVHPEVLIPRTISLPLAPPVIPHTPDPPVQRVRLQNATTSIDTPAVLDQHPRIDIHTLPIESPNDGPPTIATLNLGNPNGNGPAVPFGLESAPSGPHIAVGTSGSGSSGTGHATPTNISTGVAQGLLLTPIRPEYPRIAQIMRVSGTVTVTAIISKSGAVESARAVSGPDVLRAAAVEAVRNARYRPYLLNGQPTEVEATYTINFTLNN